LDFAGDAHLLKWASLWKRRKEGDRSTPVGDLDRLAALYEAQQFACPLA
jgi:hypothetical protein